MSYTVLTTEAGAGLLTEDELLLILDTLIPGPSPSLPEIIPSYPYEQYSDDPNIVAFFTAYNTIAQTYLNWFNNTPLALYTSSYIYGLLLDWIGNGIYGITRPIFSTLATKYIPAAVNVIPNNVMAINSARTIGSGTAILATDDYYKRTLTWYTYMGDGRRTNATVIQRRIARFLYGTNGTDITSSQAQNVEISIVTSPAIQYDITIPAGQSSSYFLDGFNSGILAFPFDVLAVVTIA